MKIHSMRIADTFTSNIYITKLNRLPAKLHAKSHFLSRSGALHPVAVARGSRLQTGRNSPRVGPHSSPDKLEKAARNCSQNTAAAQSNMEHGSPPAFQIPRQDGDEDEKGAVALEDNLRWTPGGVWVQETVHRLEPGGDTDSGSELLLRRQKPITGRRPHLDGSSSTEKAPFKLMMLLLFSNIP